jgi:UDP-glucose:(glucosyl)LPS alpha-1,2-glucosyltransferase
MKPLGGTELQYALLHKYVDKKLLNNFQITTSVPEKIPLAKDKINILWEQNSYDQPNIQPWMKDPSNHSKYDWYVFNSHWCAEKYRMFFKLPADKCTVIKNAIEHFPERKVYKKGDPIKLIFHPTPWRGLNVMLGAMQLIKNKNVTLDVYSSTEVYGTSFKKANDKIYQPLYKQAKKLPNVNYIGYKPNEQIVKNITQYQIFAYPNIWEETSCISAIEAMAAGLHMVTTNYGALYETCSEWPVYVQYSDNYKRLAEAFAYAIDSLTSFLHEDGCQNHLQSQANFYKKFYDWQGRKEDWTNFLQGVVNASKNK